MIKFIGKAEQCLKEAQKLEYAYFSPELDNFHGDVDVDDIIFKVLCEVDNLDDGDLENMVEDSEFNWNTNRNRAWRKKAVAFINKWADEAPEEMKEQYRNFR